MPSIKLCGKNSVKQWAIKADDVDERIARAIRICIGRELQGMYRELLQQPLPPKITELLQQLNHL